MPLALAAIADVFSVPQRRGERAEVERSAAPAPLVVLPAFREASAQQMEESQNQVRLLGLVGTAQVQQRRTEERMSLGQIRPGGPLPGNWRPPPRNGRCS